MMKLSIDSKWISLFSLFSFLIILKTFNKLIVKKKGKPDKQKFSILKICFTGGPCGGKTTTISYLTKKIMEQGYCVISIPELPTLLVKAGVSIQISTFSMKEKLDFFENYMRLQIKIEEIMYELARQLSCSTICLLDRSLLDAIFYQNSDTWEAIRDVLDCRDIDIKKDRYDLIFHLTTAAEGAEKFYNLSSNEARHESPETARLIDDKIKFSCLGHMKHYIVDNIKKGMKENFEFVWGIIEKELGICCKHQQNKNKIQVNFEGFTNDLKVVKSWIQKNYLVNRKLRMYLENSENQLFYFIKKNEIKVRISFRDYLYIQKRFSNKNLETRKDVSYFLHQNQKFVLIKKELKYFLRTTENISQKKIPDFIKLMNRKPNN